MKNAMNEVVEKIRTKYREKWEIESKRVWWDKMLDDIIKELNAILNKDYIKKEVLQEKIELLDLEFAIATDVIEKKTGKKVEMTEDELESIVQILKEELLNSEEKT